MRKYRKPQLLLSLQKTVQPQRDYMHSHGSKLLVGWSVVSLRVLYLLRDTLHSRVFSMLKCLVFYYKNAYMWQNIKTI